MTQNTFLSLEESLNIVEKDSSLFSLEDKKKLRKYCTFFKRNNYGNAYNKLIDRVETGYLLFSTIILRAMNVQEFVVGQRFGKFFVKGADGFLYCDSAEENDDYYCKIYEKNSTELILHKDEEKQEHRFTVKHCWVKNCVAYESTIVASHLYKDSSYTTTIEIDVVANDLLTDREVCDLSKSHKKTYQTIVPLSYDFIVSEIESSGQFGKDNYEPLREKVIKSDDIVQHFINNASMGIELASLLLGKNFIHHIDNMVKNFIIDKEKVREIVFRVDQMCE